ncbi:hypothetical protein BHM03_00057027 [Ensete ventricosum]|nr:hypothetical protein BHM03_00057027 [Ensete ventricosum]
MGVARLRQNQIWMDIDSFPVPGSARKTCSQMFEEAGCEVPASPGCAAYMVGPPETCMDKHTTGKLDMFHANISPEITSSMPKMLFGLHGVRRVTVAMGAINLVEATSGAALMGVMQQRRWCGAREMTAVGLTSSLAVARIAAMVAMAVAQELTAITIDATDEASLEDDFFRRERRVRGLQFFLK